MDWELIIEALLLNNIEEQITEQLKKKYGANVNINIRFNNKKQISNKKSNNKKFDRIKYMKECEKNWRK